MLLVTVHPASGRTALISIPRNLTQLQFPDDTPLGERFPTGFSDLANGVFTAVSNDPGLVDAYGFAGFPAEPIALSSGVAQSLDVQIDDFVLIDMLGFADVIDAVGGVTVELCQTVALPPSLPGEPPVPPEIGPGEIDMDGVTALAYARTRYADSDYERTGRQRQLLAALSSQISLVEALRAFTAVARVLDESLRTSLTVGEFDDLLQALGDNSSIVESVGLVPPLIQPSDPDYDEIRSIVADVHRAIVTGEPSGYTTDAGPEDPSDRTTDADGNCLNEGIG
jgi:LCP family protein required for cell wall assembly